MYRRSKVNIAVPAAAAETPADAGSSVPAASEAPAATESTDAVTLIDVQPSETVISLPVMDPIADTSAVSGDAVVPSFGAEVTTPASAE
jgi:hypothetical protein